MSHMSTTEKPRIDHDDEPQSEAVAPAVDTPVAEVAEDTEARIEPWVFAGGAPNRKEPMRLRNKVFIGLGAVATAATLVTLLAVVPSGGSGNGKIGNTPKPTETSQAGPTSNPNGGEVSGDVLVQTTSIEAMDSMTGPEGLKVFAKLSYADHLAYAYAKNPQMAILTPNKDDGLTDPSFIPSYLWDSVNGTALSQGDTTEGAKIAAANDYYTVDASGEIAPGYQAVVDSIKQTGGEGVRNSNTDVFVGSGEPQTGVDSAGHKISYVNVTFYDADSSSGKRQGPDKTAQAIREEVKLLNGKTVVFYPIGLTGPGHAAPDGGTY